MFNFFALSLKVPENVEAMAGQIGNPGSVGNILVVVVFLVVILLYGFLLDRHNMVMTLFASYVGLLVINFFPSNVWQIGFLESWWGQLILFIVTVVLTVIMLSMTHLFKVAFASNFLVRWWYGAISGIFYAGLLTSIVLSILPVSFLGQFSPGFLKFFIGDVASFLWLILPIVGLILIKHRRRGPGRPSY